MLNSFRSHYISIQGCVFVIKAKKEFLALITNTQRDWAFLREIKNSATFSFQKSSNILKRTTDFNKIAKNQRKEISFQAKISFENYDAKVRQTATYWHKFHPTFVLQVKNLFRHIYLSLLYSDFWTKFHNKKKPFYLHELTYQTLKIKYHWRL